ncbi:MAG: PCRF domain-containing protein, partial [Rhodanobacteraceae bacterium]
MADFYDRLEIITRRFDEIEGELAHPSGAFDQARFTALVKERSSIEETVGVYRDYKKTLEEIAAND